MTPAELQVAVGDLVRSAAARRGADLTLSDDQIVLERPRSREHGDWASTVAMRVAKQIGVSPRDLAQELATDLGALPGVAAVDVAGPGFINITLEAASAGALAARIVEEGEAYGTRDLRRRACGWTWSSSRRTRRARSTSAHPLGRARRRLARVLRAAGAEVVDEYYINDRAARSTTTARACSPRRRRSPTPEGGYGGAYIAEIARRSSTRTDGPI